MPSVVSAPGRMGPCHPNTKEHRRCNFGFPRHTPVARLQNPEVPCFYAGPVCTSLPKPPSAARRPREARAIGSTSGSSRSRCCLYRRGSLLFLPRVLPSPLLPDTLVWTHRSDACAIPVAGGPLSPSPRPLPHTAGLSREDGPPCPPGRKSEAGRPGAMLTRGTPDRPPKPSVTWVTRTPCAKTGRSVSCCNPRLSGAAAA